MKCTTAGAILDPFIFLLGREPHQRRQRPSRSDGSPPALIRLIATYLRNKHLRKGIT